MTDQLHRDGMHDERSTGAATSHQLARLDELDDFEIADGEPDIRGWSVKSADGKEVGTVENLIADPDAMEIRYLEVKVKHELLGTKDDEQVLIPIGAARLQDDVGEDPPRVGRPGRGRRRLRIAQREARRVQPLAQRRCVGGRDVIEDIHDTNARSAVHARAEVGGAGGAGQRSGHQLLHQRLAFRLHHPRPRLGHAESRRL